MASNELLIKREEGIVTATLNRPEKLNALNKDMFDGIKSLIEVIESDKAARVLIITGAGEKAFSVGADLKERQGMNEKDILVRMDFVKSLYLRLERLKVPVIAAMNGSSLGGGLELSLTCDLRVIAENATVGLPEVDLAIMPGNGGTQRLPRLIGKGLGMKMILLAEKITATKALEFGLVHAVMPQNKVMDQAIAWARKMLEAGPVGLRQAKMAVRGGLERSYEHGLEFEVECYKACLYSKDRLEGLKAFTEKRKPTYTGD